MSTLAVICKAPVPGRVKTRLTPPWSPDRSGLGERLAAAFADLGGPALIIGMDTPQVTPRLLAAGLAAIEEHGSALGLAADGGYWAIGLNRPDPQVFAGVPMSASDTGARQHERMVARGFTPALLPVLIDVDDEASAFAVAREAPDGGFAAALRALDPVAVPA